MTHCLHTHGLQTRRRDVILLIALGWVIVAALASTSQGQQQPRPSIPKMHVGLAGQLRLVDVRVSSGRLIATCPVRGQSMSSTSSGVDRRERLSLTLTDGIPSVSYEQTTAHEVIGFDIVQGNQFDVYRRSRADSGLHFALHQGADGGLSIDSRDGEVHRTFAGPTLWHLLLSEPDLCREQLVPLLSLMRPQWRLSQEAAELEQVLVRGARARPAQDYDLWHRLVVELGSNRFAERQLAEQRLSKVGDRIVQFLERYDRASLDAEQSYRVRRIARSFSGGDDEADLPRVAARWGDDPSIWFSLLTRDDQTTRSTAAEQLAMLLGEPIDFDAAGSLELRTAQRAAIGVKLQTWNAGGNRSGPSTD